MIYVYREKHKAQIFLWNWWKNSNFTIKWSRQLFFLAKLVLSLVYRSVSSVRFFPLLKNRENDMGLGNNGTKLWLVKLQSGNIRERERERERERTYLWCVSQKYKKWNQIPFPYDLFLSLSFNIFSP